MSNSQKPHKTPGEPESQSEEPESSGPNLVLLYTLLALALAFAIGFAAMIVLPFYHRT